MAPRCVTAMVAAAAIGALQARDAQACLCAAPALRSAPADGATGVPTNVRILVATGTQDVALSAGDAEVEATVRVVPPPLAAIEVVPAAELEVATTYTLRVGNEELTFRTGDGPALEAPGTPALSLSLAHAEVLDGALCRSAVTTVDLEMEVGPGDSVYEVDFFRPGDARGLHRRIVFPEDFTDLRRPPAFRCDLQAFARGGETWCVELLARDLAGNASDPVEACATVSACAPIECRGECDLTDCAPARTGGCSAPGSTPGDTAPVLLALLALITGSTRRAKRQGSRTCRCEGSCETAWRRGGT